MIVDEIDVVEFKKIWLERTNNEAAKHFGISRSTVDRMARKHNLFKWKVDFPDEFTQKQQELLTGSLLGDGSLSKVNRGKSKFSECHSVLQKDYLSWKNDVLKPFSRRLVSTPPVEVSFPNGKIGKRKESWQSYTLYHSFFYKMEKKWYLRDGDEYVLRSGRRVKCLPADLKITPFVFAVWFLDDGRNNQNQRNASISTDGFSRIECEVLSSMVERDLGIETHVRKVGCAGQYEIYIPARSYFDCMELIKSQDIPCKCMSYKFDTSKCVVKQPRLSQDRVNAIFDLRELDWTYKKIAEEVGTSKQHAWLVFNRRKHRRTGNGNQDMGLQSFRSGVRRELETCEGRNESC